ncbi:MAG: hypothetical protein J0M12_16720, partial [Deltaproteobacteria bacterium]|nr:hypothetical protein [Deltaproteobacteria bacterium]
RETPAPRIPESFIYEYKVVSAPEPLSPLNEKSVVKIKVSPTTHRDSSWLLSFNPKTNTLISVTETYTNGASTTHANPYQNDSWMSGFGDFQGIIVDFARIPVPNQNEDRVIRQEPPSTAEFTQQTRFSNGTCQVTMTITEDPPAYTVVANIGWQQGKKWWTKASIKQGSQIEIAGELIE